MQSFYDPVVGRWNVVDPLSDKYYGASGYAYVENNPIKFIDPDGRYSKLGAWFRRAWDTVLGNSPGQIYKSGKEYGYNVSLSDGTLVGYFGKGSSGMSLEVCSQKMHR